VIGERHPRGGRAGTGRGDTLWIRPRTAASEAADGPHDPHRPGL